MHKHYTTQRAVMAILIVVVVFLAVLNLAWKDGPEPDEVYEMSNKKIEWYYAKEDIKND